MFSIPSFDFDLLLEDEQPDFLDKGGFEDGGRILL